jgi:RNA polymerase-binding transcription factor DksA
MTEAERRRFRERLVDQLRELDERIVSAQERGRAAIADNEESGELGASSDVGDTELSIGSRRTEQRFEIDAALHRIDDGTFGTCEVCGRPIEIERLEAMPTVRLCAEDARQRDRTATPSL